MDMSAYVRHLLGHCSCRRGWPCSATFHLWVEKVDHWRKAHPAMPGIADEEASR